MQDKFIWSFFLVLIVAICACETTSTEETERIGAKTTPPSLLYFKNLRSIHYSLFSDPTSKLDYYTHRRWKSKKDSNYIVPVIVNDWLHDLAYIQLVNPFVEGEITISKLQDNAEQTTINFATATDHTAQAKFIYDQLLAKQKLQVLLPNEERRSIFHDANERNYFLVTLRDFLRLTEQE